MDLPCKWQEPKYLNHSPCLAECALTGSWSLALGTEPRYSEVGHSSFTAGLNACCPTTPLLLGVWVVSSLKISFVISCCILPFSYFCHFNSRKDSYKLRDQWTVVNALLVNIATSLPQGCASCIPPGVDFPQPYKLSVSHNI